MQQFVPLTGIARQAADGLLLLQKRRVDYRSLPTRKWLNRCRSKRVAFDWTINPYRGCEYGCKYCYARFTHEFMERSAPATFETEIYAKDWAIEKFRRELKSVKAGHVLALGTATDPYQPAERKFGRTRSVLEAMIGVRGISFFVTTKSDLVARDAELLAQLSLHNQVRVTSSITTTDAELARLLEPFAPGPEVRMKAVGALSRARVHVSVMASPVLPLITDSMKNLEAVARVAKTAGADQFGANVLFLQPSAQKIFFPFLENSFPQYLSRYRNNFASGAFLSSAYTDCIRSRVDQIRERVGIGKRDLERIDPPPLAGTQLLLF